MKNHFIGRAACLLFSFLIASCVSVSVPFGPVPKAEKTSVVTPPSPFTSLVTNSADEAWISEKTGNTISYLSECKKNPDKIEEIALDASQAVDRVRILKSSRSVIAGRPAVELLVGGFVDNHKVKLSIAVLQNGECTFSLTYGGTEQNFAGELKYFEDFKTGFKIP